MGREAALRRGVMLEGVTVGYNALEGLVAIAAGIAAGSVALTGFGIDSVIEVRESAAPEPSGLLLTLIALGAALLPRAGMRRSKN